MSVRRLVARLALVLAATAPPLVAQSPQVATQLKPGVVKFGGRATLQVLVEGRGDAELVSLPEVDGITWGRAYGPNRSQQSFSFNGRRTERVTTSWTVELTPNRTGEFEIPGVVVRVDGADVVTEPRLLQVLDDLRGEELGLLEIDGPEGSPVDGEPFVLEIRFGWVDGARSFVNYADLLLPWWGNVPGALIDIEPLPPDARRVEVLLNRRERLTVEETDMLERDGQRYRSFRLRLLVTPLRPGELSFAGNFLEFGEERRSRSLFNPGRQLVEQYFVGCPDLAVTVKSLPVEGQPIDFTGAIGRFDLRASPSTRDLVVGDTLKLTLDITGSGNLEFLGPPMLDTRGAFRGFQSFGYVEEKLPDRRRVVYDLVPTDAGLVEIPAVELPYYDPVEEAYARAGTEPIPIRVRPMVGAEPLDEEAAENRFEEDLRDVGGSGVASGGLDARAPRDATLAAAAAGILIGWFALRTAARQGGRRPGDATERRRARALRRLERELRTSLDAERDLVAWNGFLAARTKEPPEAWFGRDPDVWSRVQGTGRLGDASVATLRRVSGELEAAVFGTRERRVARDELLASARELMEDGL